MDLKAFFDEHPKTALALSGGVDSSFLLYAGKKLGADIQPYYVKSDFQPEFELEDAKEIAAYAGVSLKIIEADVFSDRRIIENPPERCYYCKNVIFSKILEEARRDGYTVVLDGTNASDDVSERPGMRALSELSVLSPLRECGLAKSDIRRLARKEGLKNWDKPSYACLATRIPWDTEITLEKLRLAERAENYLFSLGFADFRVRIRDQAAVLQMPEEQMPELIKKLSAVTEGLGFFESIHLDLKARKSS